VNLLATEGHRHRSRVADYVRKHRLFAPLLDNLLSARSKKRRQQHAQPPLQNGPSVRDSPPPSLTGNFHLGEGRTKNTNRRKKTALVFFKTQGTGKGAYQSTSTLRNKMGKQLTVWLQGYYYLKQYRIFCLGCCWFMLRSYFLILPEKRLP